LQVDEIRQRVATEALSWEGVKYAHQARTRRGADCVGFVVCVGRDAGVMPWVEDDPRWEAFRNYRRFPDTDFMERGLDSFLVRIRKEEAGVGDVYWYRVRSVPRHLGIIVDSRSMMHSDISKKRICRYPLRDRDLDFVRAAYRYPGLAEAAS